MRDEYFRKYGLSWNIGALSGEIAGFIIVGLGQNDFLSLQISLLIAFFQIPLSVMVAVPFLKIEENRVNQKNKNQINFGKNPIIKPRFNRAERRDHNSNYLIGLLWVHSVRRNCLEFSKDMYSFIFPILMYTTQENTAFVYFGVFIQQIMQLIAIDFNGKAKGKAKYNLFLIGWQELLGALFSSFYSNPTYSP